MILKRQEKDGKVKAMYESSNILASTYDTTTNDLTIIFKAGTQYKYTKVSKTDYMRFEIAESQGAVFNSHIKKYPTTKLESVDPARILSEATNLKAQEDRALLEAKKEKILEIARILANLIDTSLESLPLALNIGKINSYSTEFLELVKQIHNGNPL